MKLDQGIEVYRQAIQERFSALKSCIDRVMVGMSHTDESTRSGLVRQLDDKVKDLADILPNKGLPKWLTDIRTATQRASSACNEKHAEELLREIWRNRSDIRLVEFSENDGSEYDFDQMFSQYRDEGRIPELFDELVRCLKEIIDSELVDSLTAINALKDLMGMLVTNRNGSLASIKSSIFSAAYMKNVFIESLKDIPILRPFVCGFERTLQDSQSEVNRIENELASKTEAFLLDRNPQYILLADLASQGTLALPAPNTNDKETTDGLSEE